MNKLTNDLKLQGTTQREPKYIYKGVYDADYAASDGYKINDVYYKKETNKYYVIDSNEDEVEFDYQGKLFDKYFESGESLSSASLNEAVNSSLVITNALEQFLTDYAGSTMEDKMINKTKDIFGLLNNNQLLYNVKSSFVDDSDSPVKNGLRGKKIVFSINNDENNQAQIRTKENPDSGLYISSAGQISHLYNLDYFNGDAPYNETTNKNDDNYWGFGRAVYSYLIDKFGHVKKASGNRMDYYFLYTPKKPQISCTTYNVSIGVSSSFTKVLTKDVNLYYDLLYLTNNKNMYLEIKMVNSSNNVFSTNLYVYGKDFIIDLSKTDKDIVINKYIKYQLHDAVSRDSYGHEYHTYSATLKVRSFSVQTSNLNSSWGYKEFTKVVGVNFYTYKVPN